MVIEGDDKHDSHSDDESGVNQWLHATTSLLGSTDLATLGSPGCVKFSTLLEGYSKRIRMSLDAG